TIEDIPPEDRNPTVVLLLEICHRQQEEIQQLRDEIARLKGQKGKPVINPSALEGNDRSAKQRKARGKTRAGKRSKTQTLTIHEHIRVAPQADIPPGSRFRGLQPFTVQDLRVRVHNTRYWLERWEAPTGETLLGKLPPAIGGAHFGPELRTFILYQYHHAHVTQPLLLEQLQEWGLDISAGQLSTLITAGHDALHQEKDALLQTALQRSLYIQVDDTGARHAGSNGYCTHIGNALFTYFVSTDCKSRINFLSVLRAGQDDYTINDAALAYMSAQSLPKAPLHQLAQQAPKVSTGKSAWRAVLAALAITAPRHVRIATEGALLGTVIEQGVSPDLAILSDDAGQFDVLVHALCWVHAERNLVKLIGFNAAQRQALADVRSQVWTLYGALKAYKLKPSQRKRTRIEAGFDALCTTRTCFETLNQALKRMHRSKAELLRVLDRPELPLHNNASERDIREYVKKRKISGSTRSADGRRCRDTFASLKKTCRKHGLSFWDYLHDRVFGAGAIAPLAEWVFEPDANRRFATSPHPPYLGA
ncbi:MAG: transposase, partial [Lamprobacter sp.]|uniref:IS66 family transposase n=1 Tax=Lamprobacter sp. TaxID=3100796 RepID=UPI002B25EE26